MNFVIGKIGKSVQFDPNKWGPIGGDNEAPMLFLALAKWFPEHNFYMVSHSDIAKNRKRIPSNIIDLWEGCKEKDIFKRYDYTVEKANKLGVESFDGGILFAGLSSSVNIPIDVKPLSMFVNYTAPVYYFLNETNVSWMMLAPDPRYIRNGRDLVNAPLYCFSQYDFVHTHQYVNKNSELSETMFNSYYQGLEKTYFIGQKSLATPEKTENFNIILNQGGNGGLNRGSILLDFIGDMKCSIYGKWQDSYYIDERFKGPIKFTRLRPKLLRTKYSLIIPIKEGWVTSKYWELIHMGVIPFMHPYYDDQKHLPYRDELIVTSHNELKKKIVYYNEHNKERLELIKKLQYNIDNKDYNGQRLAYKIMDKVKEQL